MPPPSATANYDANYAQSLMEDLDSAPGLLGRAFRALALIGLGFLILGTTLTYNPFDTTGDTAGIGVIQNALGARGASIANFLMQFIGWGAFLAGLLCLYTGVRGIFWPRPKVRNWERLGWFGLASPPQRTVK